MPLPEMRPESLALFRAMSSTRADHFIGEVLLPSLARTVRSDAVQEAVAEKLVDGYRFLEAAYGHYAFARRGKDRFDLSEMALEALHRTAEPDDFGQFLEMDDATVLWAHFEEVCREHGRKPQEQLNRGVIGGMAELAQEIYKLDGIGSVAAWIVKGVRQTGRIEPSFLRIVDVRGIGPKIASLILRDVVLLFGLEDLVDPVDRLYVQPVDKWLRMMAPYVIDEPNADDLADWILAGKVSKYARRASVSGIRFNMGTTWFGMREVRAPEFFSSAVRHVIRDELNQPRSSAELR
jgi:hypothetical protein